MLHEKPLFYLILLVLIFPASFQSIAQCNSNISNFPYNENFEIFDGNWTVNGNLPDWEWGVVTKPVITSAGSGTKCWTTGSLTNGYYNNSESSWLQSPCFNFSSLQYPFISFLVFWETEKGFDGSNLQYSTDVGITWNNVGSVSDPINCLNSNWFNSSTVSFLNTFGSQRNGWSGSVQASCPSSGGSGGWVTAKHTLPFLAGKPSVIFRFTFAAGSLCNNFDGFAIDDINISEAPPNNGTIESNCIDSNTVKFSFNTNLCPTNFVWSFGDPVSGSDNISNLTAPQHKFTSAGNYTINLRASGPDNAPYSTSTIISILGLKTELVTPTGCNGEAIASAKVTVTGNPILPVYQWNSIPVQNTATAINLAEGLYKVTVSAANACTVNASIQISSNPLLIKDSVQMPGCVYSKGKILLSVQGGTPPYSYTWLPIVSTSNIADALVTGNYKVTIADSKNCSVTKNYTISNLPKPTISIFKISDFDCSGSKLGAASASANSGTAPYTFIWNSVPTQKTSMVQNLKPGVYFVTAKDVNGCEKTDSVKINVGGICNDIYFPTSFSPNDDKLNDQFGPLGNVIETTNYSINIYNRLGELVFRSGNPFIKWDGMNKGKKAATGAYVWNCKYLYKGYHQRSQYGTLTLIN